MAKINFTKEHFQLLCNNLVRMLLDNIVIHTKFGQILNVVELLHTTTIGTLNSIRAQLSKQIEEIENQDEWVGNENTSKIELLKFKKETVNLIIGYNRYLLEQEETKAKKAELEFKIKELKEASKTPEDKLRELEAELASIDTVEF